MKNHENIRKIATLRGYARSRAARRLPGGTVEAVRRAHESGRLGAAIVQTADGAICVDVAAADAAWSASTRQRIDYEIGRAAPTGSPQPESDARDPDLDAIADALVRAALESAPDPAVAGVALADRLVELLTADGADEIRCDQARDIVEDTAAEIADRRLRRDRNGKTPIETKEAR